ncbi:MAG: hypothetical protein IJX94_05500 [Clostridia bacterium]|nr:hypothetical protein [Clostridia bacterium]
MAKPRGETTSEVPLSKRSVTFNPHSFSFDAKSAKEKEPKRKRQGMFRRLRAATKGAAFGNRHLFEKRSIKNFLASIAVSEAIYCFEVNHESLFRLYGADEAHPQMESDEIGQRGKYRRA